MGKKSLEPMIEPNQLGVKLEPFSEMQKHQNGRHLATKNHETAHLGRTEEILKAIHSRLVVREIPIQANKTPKMKSPQNH